MSVSPFDSTLYGALLSDAETAAVFSDATQLRALLQVEVALAKAEARCGLIPQVAAARIADVAATLELDPAALAAGTAGAGVPVPALVVALREAVGDPVAAWVHYGMTSQDVIDTALVLRLRDLLARFEARLEALIAALAELAEAHRGTVMAGRTRAQQAAPTTFGLKAAGWLMPLVRHRDRLHDLRPRLLLLSCGGAAGNLAALGDQALAVEAALAEELDLAVPALPWHAQRDGLAELGGWLALLTGSLGKLGQDLVLLAQSEVAEARPGAGGGSSTMPQKANPVGGEILVALARFNAAQLAAVQETLLAEQERGGASWMLEWLALPQMAAAAGAALARATEILADLVVHPDRMRSNLAQSRGLIMAEAASFALAEHMPRPEAQALVKAACREVADNGRHLMAVLAERTDAPVDWDALADPRSYLGAADALIDRALAAARR